MGMNARAGNGSFIPCWFNLCFQKAYSVIPHAFICLYLKFSEYQLRCSC